MARRPAEELAAALPLAEVLDDLMDWYRHTARALPWREAHASSYDILLSEFLLQQTQVRTALPYFHAFKRRFPTLGDLARSPLEDVLDAWSGLGYYRRARYLHETAQVIVERHRGEVPMAREDLMALPGVGSYTAAAIRAFAFNQPAGAVDANVGRVLGRLLASHAVPERLEEWLARSIPKGLSRSTNSALMELGALVCQPRSPNCPSCPLRPACRAYALDAADTFPARTATTPKRTVDVTIAIVGAPQGLVVERRPEGELLAGMLGLPTFPPDSLPTWLAITESCGNLRQVYSHRVWQATVVRAQTTAPLPDGFFRLPWPDLAAAGFARIYRRALNLYVEEVHSDAE